MEICRRLKRRSILDVCEHFSDKQSFEDDTLSLQRPQFVVRRVAYLEICRRLKKQSRLDVCEHFALKPDAEDNALPHQRKICCQKALDVVLHKRRPLRIVHVVQPERSYF